MSRPLRLEHEGALWHVTSRGDDRRAIFEDDGDRQGFLDVLAGVIGMFRWRLHAYVLMGNHYHLLVETPEANLGRGMRQLNGIYTQRMNRRHRRVGHLFQGRYKAILVEREAHLVELGRYIVLNPVRAGMVRSAANWPWSSYAATAGLRNAEPWLEAGPTLEWFGRARGPARVAYRRFVAEGKNAGYDPWSAVTSQVVLGSEEFADLAFAASKKAADSTEIPRGQRLLGRPGAKAILAAVSEEFGETPEAVRRSRGGPAREAFAYLARKVGALPIAAIGEMLGLRSWSGSHLATAGRERCRDDAAFRKKVERVETHVAKSHKSRPDPR